MHSLKMYCFSFFFTMSPSFLFSSFEDVCDVSHGSGSWWSHAGCEWTFSEAVHRVLRAVALPVQGAWRPAARRVRVFAVQRAHGAGDAHPQPCGACRQGPRAGLRRAGSRRPQLLLEPERQLESAHHTLRADLHVRPIEARGRLVVVLLVVLLIVIARQGLRRVRQGRGSRASAPRGPRPLDRRNGQQEKPGKICGHQGVLLSRTRERDGQSRACKSKKQRISARRCSSASSSLMFLLLSFCFVQSSDDDSVTFDMSSFHTNAKSLILSGDLKFEIFRGNLAIAGDRDGDRGQDKRQPSATQHNTSFAQPCKHVAWPERFSSSCWLVGLLLCASVCRSVRRLSGEAVRVLLVLDQHRVRQSEFKQIHSQERANR